MRPIQHWLDRLDHALYVTFPGAGVFLAVCNGVVNPLIYVSLMPAFRTSLKLSVFGLFCVKSKKCELIFSSTIISFAQEIPNPVSIPYTIPDQGSDNSPDYIWSLYRSMMNIPPRFRYKHELIAMYSYNIHISYCILMIQR